MHIVLASLSFPWWLRLEHYINLLFTGLLIRSGIQIITAHPRFYWHYASDPTINFMAKEQRFNSGMYGMVHDSLIGAVSMKGAEKRKGSGLSMRDHRKGYIAHE
ncbi:MAG TPA: hypothetical protein VFQ30_17430 [Ktedonobacteraceae bacterium]|nr:hypothetical protein [Ktedonobacteraceae bacterium]